MTKQIYCHVYQGNSQGSGKLNGYSIRPGKINLQFIVTARMKF